MKVIIAGGRKFDDYLFLEERCDHLLANSTDIEIISGAAPIGNTPFGKLLGADQLGQFYALQRGYPVTTFPAQWEEFSRAAGPIRNNQMAKHSDALIAFWNGFSTGTENMIVAARKYGLRVKVCRYTETNHPGFGDVQCQDCGARLTWTDGKAYAVPCPHKCTMFK